MALHSYNTVRHFLKEQSVLFIPHIILPFQNLLPELMQLDLRQFSWRFRSVMLAAANVASSREEKAAEV